MASAFIERSRARLLKKKEDRVRPAVADMSVSDAVREVAGAAGAVDSETGEAIQQAAPVQSEAEKDRSNLVRFGSPTAGKPLKKSPFMKAVEAVEPGVLDAAQAISDGLTGGEGGNNLAPANVEASVNLLAQAKEKEVTDFIRNSKDVLGVEVSKSDEKAAKENLTSPDKLSSLIQRLDDRVTGKKKKEPSSSDLFSMALLGLLPTVVGALFEGSEGAAVGGEVGLKAMGQFQGAQQRELELAQKQAQHDDNLLLSAVKFQETQRGRAAASGAKPITEFQKRSLGLRQQELDNFQLAEERRAKSLGLSESKAGQLSDKQVEDLSNIKFANDTLGNIDLKGLSSTGPVEGRIRDFGRSLGLGEDADFNEIKSQTGLFLADYMKQISGAAVSELEAKRLEALLPNVKDNEKLFVSKLNTFQKRLDRSLKAKVTGITRGQKLKAEAAQRFLAPAQEEVQKTISKKQRLLELREKHARK